MENPAGEWNTLECVCDGDKITNILNGKVVNVGTKSSLTRGQDPVPVGRGRGVLPQDRFEAAQEVSFGEGPPARLAPMPGN